MGLVVAKKTTKNSVLTALGRHKMRKKTNSPKSRGNFVVNIPEITYKKNWAILIKIEGPDAISAEVFFPIFFADSAKKLCFSEKKRAIFDDFR